MVERHGQDGGGREKEKRHVEIMWRDTEELQKSRNKGGTIKQMLWSVCCFQTWCKKDLAIGFKSITTMELNQSLSVLCPSEKRDRWTLRFQQLC